MIQHDSDSDSLDDEFTSEVKALMVSNPKKFFKKSYSKFKGNKFNKGNNKDGTYNKTYDSEKEKGEGYRKLQKEEEKKEKNLLGDSSYDCNYVNGKYHFAKECMLRKLNEKKENTKDEAY